MEMYWKGHFVVIFMSGMDCICLKILGNVTEHCEIWPFQYVRLLRKCVGNVYLSSSVFSHTDEEVNKNHTQQHFQRIFWEQQHTYNRLKNKKRMRWHPLMIRFELNLRYLSSTAYRSVGSFLALPYQRTLRDYTHVMKFDAGVSGEVVKRLKEDMNFDQCSSSQKKVTVIMDEMKIKSGLVFNKSIASHLVKNL